MNYSYQSNFIVIVVVIQQIQRYRDTIGRLPLAFSGDNGTISTDRFPFQHFCDPWSPRFVGWHLVGTMPAISARLPARYYAEGRPIASHTNAGRSPIPAYVKKIFYISRAILVCIFVRILKEYNWALEEVGFDLTSWVQNATAFTPRPLNLVEERILWVI